MDASALNDVPNFKYKTMKLQVNGILEKCLTIHFRLDFVINPHVSPLVNGMGYLFTVV